MRADLRPGASFEQLATQRLLLDQEPRALTHRTDIAANHHGAFWQTLDRHHGLIAGSRSGASPCAQLDRAVYYLLVFNHLQVRHGFVSAYAA